MIMKITMCMHARVSVACMYRIPSNWLTHSFGWHFSLSGDHTETVEIDYDPKVTTYRDLLKLFWENHDPTRYKYPPENSCTHMYTTIVLSS